MLYCVCSVLQVIPLQNQIWSLEQLKLQGGETTPQQDREIQGK